MSWEYMVPLEKIRRLGEGLGKNTGDFPEFHGANHGKKAGKSCMVSLF